MPEIDRPADSTALGNKNAAVLGTIVTKESPIGPILPLGAIDVVLCHKSEQPPSLRSARFTRGLGRFGLAGHIAEDGFRNGQWLCIQTTQRIRDSFPFRSNDAGFPNRRLLLLQAERQDHIGIGSADESLFNLLETQRPDPAAVKNPLGI